MENVIFAKTAHSTMYIDKQSTDTQYIIKRYPIYKNTKSNEIVQKILQAEQIPSHPNVIKYVKHQVTANEIIIYFEMANQGSLEDIRRNTVGLFDEILLKQYLLQALKGLEHIHSCDLMHRNITPKNVLVHNGIVKLGGLDKINPSPGPLTLKNTILCTPYTIAPEILNLEGASQASDIYELGATFYFLMTSSYPFQDDNVVTMVENTMDMFQFHKPAFGYSAELQQIINSMLWKYQDERPDVYFYLSLPFLNDEEQVNKIQQDNSYNYKESVFFEIFNCCLNLPEYDPWRRIMYQGAMNKASILKNTILMQIDTDKFQECIYAVLQGLQIPVNDKIRLEIIEYMQYLAYN
ncbi:Kinase [Hexamita inflata]|uniref:Kinase n=1 Tax=Hexamita inflata TaxID=28002 RepID=A0AA86NM72_9EUKA|nr:Kinase [Hexamita inflata]